MQNQWELWVWFPMTRWSHQFTFHCKVHQEMWLNFYLPFTHQVLMSLQSIDFYDLCEVKSLSLLISICSHFAMLLPSPQIHLRSAGIRFSPEAHSLVPCMCSSVTVCAPMKIWCLCWPNGRWSLGNISSDAEWNTVKLQWPTSCSTLAMKLRS